MAEVTIEMVVRLKLDQIKKLITIAELFTEPWDKTIQDAIDIALNHYRDMIEAEGRKREAAASC